MLERDLDKPKGPVEREKESARVVILVGCTDLLLAVEGVVQEAAALVAAPSLSQVHGLFHELVEYNEARKAPEEDLPPSLFVLDPVRQEVSWGDGRIRLTPQEVQVLDVLNGSWAVTTFAELSEAAWGHPAIADTAAIRSAVSRLRRKLEAKACPATIVSVPAVGFRLECSGEPSRPADPVVRAAFCHGGQSASQGSG